MWDAGQPDVHQRGEHEGEKGDVDERLSNDLATIRTSGILDRVRVKQHLPRRQHHAIPAADRGAARPWDVATSRDSLYS